MNNTLHCVKGDELKFFINLTDVDGNPYELGAEEVLTFKVKEHLYDTTVALEVESDSPQFYIEEITLEAGSYYFEVSITLAGSTILTVIPAARSRLNVSEEL